ncbi:U-scoloptoxin(01)-Er1a-like isoform X1 [Palaemon carinicauda]|uniref:U-scoloptoxin(01)-Er1a-like isoform X1 n=1 Tax=Palaemon carinicauda TaxID=392227 RepID=UPI0035B67C63
MLLKALLLVLSTTSALPRLVKRDSTPLFYELPSNASLVLGQIRNGFDCANRAYGYYADQSNNCAIFHVCYPYVDAEGNSFTRMFSFLCGQGSIFDQSTLTCNFPEQALPCEAANTYYNINDYFGRENVQFRDGSVNGIF